MSCAAAEIDILRGAEATSLLANDGFLGQWSSLCEQCPWATAFQRPGFVTAWYRTYRDRVQPVLAIQREADGRLSGLLTLGIYAADDRLVVAGAHHAEYHTWICRPDSGDAFISLALQKLHKEIPAGGLRFRYLPPGTPTAWVRSDARRSCLLTAHRRPVMRFGDGAEIAESLSKGSNKSRLRRLEKTGPIEFKQIIDPAEFEEIFSEFARFYDFRRAAVYGLDPFESDDRIKPFHIEMLKVPGLLHLTVLRVGGQLAAAHVGACTRKEVQLGLIVHNPFLAKHSPGKFHIFFLARMLMQAGYEQFDLTAGGDPYKARFANAWDDIHALSVFPTWSARQRGAIVESVRATTKTLLLKSAIRPARARSCLASLKRLGPAGIVATSVRNGRVWAASRRESRIYFYEVARARDLKADEFVRRDCLEDLLAYHPVDGGTPRNEFFSASLDRTASGQHAYTRAGNGRLLHLGWLIDRPSESLVSEVLPGFSVPPDCVLLLNFQAFPGGHTARDLHASCLGTMLRDASRIPGIKRLCVAVPGADSAVRDAVEALGCKYDCSLFEQTRFGIVRRWIPERAEPAVADDKPNAGGGATRARARTDRKMKRPGEYAELASQKADL